MEEKIGRLKKTLSDRCPICNRNLQIRVLGKIAFIDGEETIRDEEYIKCSVCDYSSSIKKDFRKKKKSKDKGRKNNWED